MEPTARTTRCQTIAQIVAWVIFVVACGLFVVGLIQHYRVGMNCDLSSDVLLSKYLAEGKGFIISDQWFYSTELHFIHNQLIFTPLFWLTSDWFIVQTVGVMILNALMLLAFYFLLWTMRQDRLFPWLATFLLLPISYEAAHFINFAVAYTTYVTMAMVIWGLIFLTLRTTTRKKWIWCLVGLAVVSVLTGIGGTRALTTIAVPIVGAALFYWLFNRKTARKRLANRFLMLALVAFAALFVGWLINLLLGNWLHFDPFEKKYEWIFTAEEWQTTNGFNWRDWWNRIGSFVRVFGVEFTGMGENLFVRVVMNCLAVGVIVFYLVATITILIKHKKYPTTTVLLTAFTAVCFGILFVVVAFTTIEYYARFYLPASFFAVPVIALYLTHEIAWEQLLTRGAKKFKAVLTGIVWVATLALVLMTYIEFYFFHRFVWCGTYHEELDEIVDLCIKEGYTQGYCSFYYYNLLTQIANGELETWGYKHLGMVTNFDDLYPWLQLTDHLEHRPTGKVFFLVSRLAMEDMFYLPMQLTRAKICNEHNHVLFHSDAFILYGFDSVEQLIDETDIINQSFTTPEITPDEDLTGGSSDFALTTTTQQAD